MRVKRKIAACVSLAAVSSLITARIYHEIGEIKNGVHSLPGGFTVTAHTGSNGTEMNSFASLASALNGKADIAEFDLNFTKSGKPVLSHNEPNGNHISLSDAFTFTEKHSGKRINVDVKTTAFLEKLPEIAEACGVTDRIFFTGIEAEDIPAVKEKAPSIPYWLNCKPDKKRCKNREYICSLVKEVKESGAVGININLNYASKMLVDVMHDNGLLVSVWTANTIGQMIKMLKLAPDNITTKKPDFLVSLINAFSK